MKKDKLCKGIFIIVLLLMLGSWIIPAGIYSSGEFTGMGHEPLGLFDLFLAPFQFFNWDFIKTQLSTDGTTVIAYSYASILLVIFMVGILYSVLNHTGAYGRLVNDVTVKFKKNRKAFFVGTSIFFMIFSSLVGVKLLSFILIPFFITILLKLNYSRISSFVATFLATLVGSVTSIAGSEITGINNIMQGLTIKDSIVFRILLFLLFVVIFLLYALYKREPVLEKEELDEKIVTNKKSYVPIILLCLLSIIILIVGSYNWYYVFGNATLANAYEDLMATTVGSYPIVKNVFGMMETFGYWSGFTISGILLIVSLTLCFIYSFSLEEVKECFKVGIQKMARPVLYVILASIPLVLLTKLGGRASFFTAIVGFIHEHITSMAVPFTVLSTVIYSIFTGDYYVVSSALSDIITSNYQEDLLSISVLAMQMIHGIICLVTPTSLFLVAGLTYLKIPYQKWLSYIFKLIFILLALTVVFLLLISLV